MRLVSTKTGPPQLKHILSSIFLLLVITYSAKSQDPVEESLERLVGRVSTVRTEKVEFSYDSGKQKKGQRLLLSKDGYDPNRNLTRSINYKPDGSIDYEWTPPADPSEEKGIRGCSTCEATEFKIKHDYDEKGRTIKDSDYTLQGELMGYREYLYDSAGNMIEEREYYKDSSLQTKLVHTYDNSGNRTSTTKYDSDGNLYGKWESHYNPQQWLTEEIAYNSDGSLLSKTRYRYDDAGNVIEEAHYNEGDTLSSKTIYSYKYDSKGNWIKRTTYEIIWLSSKIIFEGMKELLYRTIIYY